MQVQEKWVERSFVCLEGPVTETVRVENSEDKGKDPHGGFTLTHLRRVSTNRDQHGGLAPIHLRHLSASQESGPCVNTYLSSLTTTIVPVSECKCYTCVGLRHVSPPPLKKKGKLSTVESESFRHTERVLVCQSFPVSVLTCV